MCLAAQTCNVHMTAVHSTRSRIIRRVFVFPFVMCCVVVAAAAGEHPVHLEKTFDPAKCVDCHKNKTQGKAVHTAITAGCDTCHVIQNLGTVTSVATVAKGKELCLTCHTDKDKTQAKGAQHPPVEQDCTKCHDPHSSAYPFQLVKERSGGKNENLCLACHDKGINVAAAGSRHAALDAGCDTCHVTHKSGDPGKVEFAYHLAKSPPALCLDCHDGKDKQLAEAHRGQPFAQADCTGCHDAHQSASPKLLNQYLHFPFGEKMCEACHQAPKNGKVVLIEDGKFPLCYTCHDEIRKLVEQSKNQHSAFVVIERCTECHNPHASRFPRNLKLSPVAVCEQCHEDRAQQHKSAKFLHQPAFKDGCYFCHQPHGSENNTLLRVAQVNDLCFTCHGANPRVEKKPDATLAAFDGKLQLPGDYLRSIRRIEVSSSGRGHPIANHPVSGVPDPSNSGQKMACISCHDPHASDASRRMFRLKPGAKSICLKCHG